jgi:hypothetical protein
MKKKILLISIIVGIVAAASVLIALSFAYPEETVEIPISGTLSPDKPGHHILGYLKYNSAVGLSIDIDGDYEGIIRIEFIDIDDNDCIAGTGVYPESGHVEKGLLVVNLFRGDYYILEMKPEGDGDYPLLYNGTIYITQRGVWWW